MHHFARGERKRRFQSPVLIRETERVLMKLRSAVKLERYGVR